MSDALIVVDSPFGVLALTQSEITQAIERAKALMPATMTQTESIAPERLLTAEQMQEITGVPSSWYAEAARRGTIPVVHLGRYPRFRLSEVVAATRVKEHS